MPTISPFGFDGNHFGVWPPPVNTYKHICKYQHFLPSFSPLWHQGKGLTNAEWRLISPFVETIVVGLIYWIWKLHTDHTPPEHMLNLLNILNEVQDSMTPPNLTFPITKDSWTITLITQHNGVTYLTQ